MTSAKTESARRSPFTVTSGRVLDSTSRPSKTTYRSMGRSLLLVAVALLLAHVVTASDDDNDNKWETGSRKQRASQPRKKKAPGHHARRNSNYNGDRRINQNHPMQRQSSVQSLTRGVRQMSMNGQSRGGFGSSNGLRRQNSGFGGGFGGPYRGNPQTQRRDSQFQNAPMQRARTHGSSGFGGSHQAKPKPQRSNSHAPMKGDCSKRPSSGSDTQSSQWSRSATPSPPKTPSMSPQRANSFGMSSRSSTPPTPSSRLGHGGPSAMVMDTLPKPKPIMPVLPPIMVGDVRFSQQRCSVNFTGGLRTIFDSYHQVMKALMLELKEQVEGTVSNAHSGLVEEFLNRQEFAFLRLDSVTVYRGPTLDFRAEGKVFKVPRNSYYSNNNRRLVVLKMIKHTLNIDFRAPLAHNVREAHTISMDNFSRSFSHQFSGGSKGLFTRDFLTGITITSAPLSNADDDAKLKTKIHKLYRLSSIMKKDGKYHTGLNSYSVYVNREQYDDDSNILGTKRKASGIKKIPGLRRLLSEDHRDVRRMPRLQRGLSWSLS